MTFKSHFKCLKECLRDAFKKKNKCDKWGRGGPYVKMSHFYKLCLKSIASHYESE